MNTATAAPTATFQVGTTYTTRFACNSETVISFKVIRRTAKFITVERPNGDVSRVGVKTDNEGEWALPTGTYSMAPTIRASRINDDR